MTSAVVTVADLYRAIPAPIVAVAAHVDGHDHAFVVSSFVALSEEPPLVGISAKTESTTWPILRRAPELGLSVLTAAHADLLGNSWRAASHERLAGTRTYRDGEAIVVDDAPLAMTCRVVDEIRTGDHLLVVLALQAVVDKRYHATPIVHYNRRITSLEENK